MTEKNTRSKFKAQLLRPKDPGPGKAWAFVVLPKEASSKLARRGRTTVEASINGEHFSVLLEPDGQKSHWLRIDEKILKKSGAAIGEVAEFEIVAAAQEPDPEPPKDFNEALNASPESRATWDSTTTVARVDWIHWITSAKQEKTRAKRISDACDMLASGKKRVCCFDPSGFYSKAFCAPQSDD